MKRLYIFSIRAFTGPFIVTLCISMFLLVMQFFWKYIDDLMGKGIGIGVISELLLYVSASLIPLALPLAILLSSIMTFGNLSERNELTALKASGLSLFRIIKPLGVIVVIIAISTFYFANYVIPVANFKLHSLIYDLQNTKISLILSPGKFTKELDGYAIKAKSGENGHFNDIIIHDQTSPKERKTIRAKEANVYKSTNGKFLYFELIEGNVSEELDPRPSAFTENNQIIPGDQNARRNRRSSFKRSTYKISLEGFNLSRSDEDLFKDEHEMLNVFQINHALDSVQNHANKVIENFYKSSLSDQVFLKAKNFVPDSTDTPSPDNKEKLILFEDLSKNEQLSALQTTITKMDRTMKNLEGQDDFMRSMNNNFRDFEIEFHRKFSLTYAILVLFFVGAPLGAIVRRGGFGAPVVIAALLFMVYYILISLGETFVDSGEWNTFFGMWFASIILTPIALLLFSAAANDSPVFSMETYTKFWDKLFRK